MPIIRSIYGDEIDVGSGAYPEAHKRLPYSAIAVAEVWRGENFWMELEDIYYLCYSKSKKFRVLWRSYNDMNDKGDIIRSHQPLTWCPVIGGDPKSAASAMLEFIWSAGDMFNDDCKITGGGLLSVAALKEIRDVVFGVVIKDSEPFVEPEDINGKGLGIRIRIAGPNNPIYRNGWTVGELRLPNYQDSVQPMDQQVVDPQFHEESDAQELNEFIAQIALEAREQWSDFDPDCIEAFKRGDRIGLPFEGGTMFQPVNERRLVMALLSNQGSDESSIVDCFLRFAGGYEYTSREQFAWDWVDCHEQKHGTGYGRTYRDHFNLVAYIRKHTEKYPDLGSRIEKLEEIARDADSYGNGSLALVYPAYYYAAIIGEEPYEFVRYVTSLTHAHADTMKAVTLMCDFIGNPRLIAEYQVPTEEEIKRLYSITPNPTACNTLMTAIYIADAGTEMEVIRRGVETGGDTDSTLATAMLLWSLKQKA